MVVQYWVHATILFPDSITPGGPQAHHFTRFSPGVGHMHYGIPCHHIVTTVDIVDAA